MQDNSLMYFSFVTGISPLINIVVSLTCTAYRYEAFIEA